MALGGRYAPPANSLRTRLDPGAGRLAVGGLDQPLAGRRRRPDWLVARLSVIATQGHIPDLTILLDLDPSLVHARTDTANDFSGLREEQTRFDKEAEQFHHKVREAFLTLARLYPERIKVLDASQSPQEIHEEIIALVEPLV